MSPVRLGILSTAKITGVVVTAVRYVEEISVVAVASRTVEKAESFAKKYDIPTACDYKSLIANPDVDAVYIPLPTALAGTWAVDAARSGKHVLVDKPFLSAETVRAISEAADSAGVIFLDGTHFVHSRRTATVRELIREGKVGKVRGVVASFTVPLDLSTNIRKKAELEPQGAIGDLGWYCARTAVTFLGVESTKEINEIVCVGRRFDDAPGVNEARGVVVFTDGTTLNFDCAFSDIVMRQRMEVVGEQGAIRMDGFVVPDAQWDVPWDGVAGKDINTQFEIETRVEDSGWPLPSTRETIVVQEGETQASRMVTEFSRLIQENDTEKNKAWQRESLQTQLIIDAMHSDLSTRLSS